MLILNYEIIILYHDFSIVICLIKQKISHDLTSAFVIVVACYLKLFMFYRLPDFFRCAGILDGYMEREGIKSICFRLLLKPSATGVQCADIGWDLISAKVLDQVS